MWPTPTVSYGRNATSGRKPDTKHHSGTTLYDVAYLEGGKLNPTWVEWLMGYPTGWTDLED
jgi:DNA (cytosine-5)-methyltransferase 1